MKTRSITIDIVSDVVCPWCIIGYKHLTRALEQISNEVTAEIRWHPFEINPTMPEGGENLREHLSAKYGTSHEESINARAHLSKLGKEVGFKFDYFDDMKMFNTFLAHQLLHYARLNGKETALKLRLFTAYFSERKTLDSLSVLIEEASKVGLDPLEAKRTLESMQLADVVAKEEGEWKRKGITAVPCFIIDGKAVVQGAQPTDVFVDMLSKT